MRAEHCKEGDRVRYEDSYGRVKAGRIGSVLATQVAIEDREGFVVDYIPKGLPVVVLDEAV